MATAKKCDICGGYYDNYDSVIKGLTYVNGISFVSIDERQGFVNKKLFDCCPKCMVSINERILELKERRNDQINHDL